MGFRKDTGNRALNTIWILPRTAGTWLHAIEDATKTVLYTVLNTGEWFGKTATNIKDAIHNACTNWPWYHKLWKAPLSIATSPIMAIEWVAETLLYSWFNLVRHARDTIANPFINFWNSVKRMFSNKNIGDFKFEKVSKSEVTPNNRLASLF